MLENVLNWINQNKTGSYKSSIIGHSMGGLITRWCLRDMEDRGLDHEVENYFSYDAPHQGANVPLGMQYIFNEMERDMLYLRFAKSFRQIADANRSPAGRQMLVTRPADDPDGLAVRAEFAARLENKGYPQQTNNYGIAFGRGDNTAGTNVAGNGEQWGGFGPGDQIYEGNLTYFLVNFQSEAYAVPDNGMRQLIAKYNFEGWATRKIFGLIPVSVPIIHFKKVYLSAYYPYDDAPGGYDITQYLFVTSLNSGKGWANGAAGTPTTFGHNGHNFLSMVSALDLRNQGYSASNNWKSNQLYFPIDDFIQNPGTVYGSTLSDPSLSPFQAVVTSSINFNRWHNGDIAPVYAEFIIQKIFHANPAFNCTDDAFCNAQPYISGRALFCDQATYSINDLPGDVTITWSSQNNKASVTQGQGTPDATFLKTTSGTETIQATITSPCGAAITITKAVSIGTPSRPGTIDIEMDAPPQRFTASIDYIEGATSYNWYMEGVLNSSHSTVAIFERDSPYCGGYYVVEVEAVNTCGASFRKYGYVYESPCSTYSLRLTPNPSSGETTVTLANEKSEVIAPGRDWDLEVYNRDQQIIYFERELKHPAVKLETSHWKAGIYLVRVLYQGEVLTTKLVVAQ